MKYFIFILVVVLGLGAWASQSHLMVGYTGKTDSYVLPMTADRAYAMFVDAERPSGSPAGLIVERSALSIEHMPNGSIIYTVATPDGSVSRITIFISAEENDQSSVRAEVSVPKLKRADGLKDYPQPYFAKVLDGTLEEIAQRANGTIKTHFPVGGQLGAFLLGLEAAFDPEASRLLETNTQLSYNQMELNSIDFRGYTTGTSKQELPQLIEPEQEPVSHDADGWAI